MSNTKKANDFFAKVKEAGRDEAFGKITGIAFEALGCYLEDLIDDGMYEIETLDPS